MKRMIYATASLCAFFLISATNVHSQTQEVGGYTFIKGETGSQVCMGEWTPPSDVGKPGICQGPVMDVSQLTAISSKQSVDRLDQLLVSLASIDQRLAVGNDRLQALIETTANTQASIDQQVRLMNEFLHGAIARRFEELPKEMLKNELFRHELDKLKDDILRDVDKFYEPRTP